jgi:glucose/arabinose dehydrogenase/mono/diheme cytochrome c family protein/HEAT repeat protein
VESRTHYRTMYWMNCRLALISIFLLLPPGALGQQGDNPGAKQPPPPDWLRLPPSPPLSPEEALRAFKVPPGFRVELVAAEPLVEAPVAMAFDPDGRIYVVEMRGFMPNVAGEGEDEPVGRVVVLEDTNGDGRMDSSRVFLDGLVMPRALALVQGGVLVAEPPHLWFCRDTNGDGKADEKIEVADDYGSQANPEHTANGLLWALDNWIYSANHTVRFRNTDGSWHREPAIFRGQWGIAQDDYGRLFFNSNSDQFRGSLVPAHYLERNPHYPGAAGGNAQIARDQSTWPARLTPGINRGYQPQMLREGKLARFTAACGPVIYRGANFPEEFRGNGFVCEPSGNFIRRNIIMEDGVRLTAANPYEQDEFLTSTDERFRPVNLYNGPDGALYIVDMHRGILQHRIYLTSFLRNQILERGLDTPLNLGRIYRVVYEGNPLGPQPNLSKASARELVEALLQPHGWWRDTAQQLLVERQDQSAVPLLRALIRNRHSVPALSRLGALWTLEGLNSLDSAILLRALSDPEEQVRAAAIRLSERLVNHEGNHALIGRLLGLTQDRSPHPQLQLAFTLGELQHPQAEEALAVIARANTGNVFIRDAIITSLAGRELEFLERLLRDRSWRAPEPGRQELLQGLARAIFNERDPDRVEQLLALAAHQGENLAWRKLALLDGVTSVIPPSREKTPPKVKPVKFEAEPAALQALHRHSNSEMDGRLEKLDLLFTWGGKNNDSAASARPLTDEEQELFNLGRTLYITACAACHQLHGKGQEGLAPPLINTDWVLGSERRLAKIVLHGVRGPITVLGNVYDMEMPAMEVLDDEDIAAILTYIRREWGHTADPVHPSTVEEVRARHHGRYQPWTEPELLNIH